jgi:predicted RNA-binding Zn ribbon-like protein
VRRLRTALHDVLLDRGNSDALGVVATFADRAARASHLGLMRGGVAERLLPDPVEVGLGLLPVAAAAEDLLRDPRSLTVSACPGEDCGWMFLDPRGRRRWCSMTSCGNRAKVRAHAARQRASG